MRGLPFLTEHIQVEREKFWFVITSQPCSQINAFANQCCPMVKFRHPFLPHSGGKLISDWSGRKQAVHQCYKASDVRPAGGRAREMNPSVQVVCCLDCLLRQNFHLLALFEDVLGFAGRPGFTGNGFASLNLEFMNLCQFIPQTTSFTHERNPRIKMGGQLVPRRGSKGSTNWLRRQKTVHQGQQIAEVSLGHGGTRTMKPCAKFACGVGSRLRKCAKLANMVERALGPSRCPFLASQQRQRVIGQRKQWAGTLLQKLGHFTRPF